MQQNQCRDKRESFSLLKQTYQWQCSLSSRWKKFECEVVMLWLSRWCDGGQGSEQICAQAEFKHSFRVVPLALDRDRFINSNQSNLLS